MFVHPYDLTIDPDKIGLILKYAHVVRERIPGLVSAFVAAVRGRTGPRASALTHVTTRCTQTPMSSGPNEVDLDPNSVHYSGQPFIAQTYGLH